MRIWREKVVGGKEDVRVCVEGWEVGRRRGRKVEVVDVDVVGRRWSGVRRRVVSMVLV